MYSHVERRGNVLFPEFKSEKHYMVKIETKLPQELARWQSTVDSMLSGLSMPKGYAYLMVDEAFVEEGSYHRRPGVHIDGYWDDGISAHGGRHSPTYPNHRARLPRHSGGSHVWADSNFEEDEALILASNIGACRGYVGEYSGEILEGGDCSKIDLTGLSPIEMIGGICYAGNVTALHESTPLPYSAQRQLVRLNVPGLKLAA